VCPFFACLGLRKGLRSMKTGARPTSRLFSTNLEDTDLVNSTVGRVKAPIGAGDNDPHHVSCGRNPRKPPGVVGVINRAVWQRPPAAADARTGLILTSSLPEAAAHAKGSQRSLRLVATPHWT